MTTEPLAVFVDFDGTITDIDTFDALVRASVGDAVWDAIDADLRAGRISLRDALAEQARAVRFTRDEALDVLAGVATVDPTFAPFVERVRQTGGSVVVLSSGIEPVIRHALERAAVQVEIRANDVDFGADGWTLRFRDDSANGHDKAAAVRAARDRGAPTVYVGDGISDFEAALVADRRFAKKNRALEAYVRARDVPCTSFAAFSEIERALFGDPPVSAAASR